jgi:protocatechuate 3,4-dioxygenase alpha subunit
MPGAAAPPECAAAADLAADHRSILPPDLSRGLLEAWQADGAGRFRHPADPEWRLADPDFLGWGRASTDTDGRYEFHTLLPGGYAEGGARRAPHINLIVMGSGLMRHLLTTMFFPDFPTENATDPVLALVPAALRARLVATFDGEADGIRAFRFDLRLRGGPDEETPFFEV